MNLINTLINRAITLFILFFASSVFGQAPDKHKSVHHKIQQYTDQIYDSLVQIRRDFHVYPEVGEKEIMTSKKIEKYLKSLGLQVHANIGGYGVVGVLRTNREGKAVAWRADIDAMPSTHPDVVDFPSKHEGVRHICGHDVHTTIALGMANVLSKLKDELSGTLYFVFQPSEENWVGAQAMIDDGLFDLIKPEEIYAAHIAPMAEGVISTKERNPFADHKGIQISFKKTDDTKAVKEYTKALLLKLQNVAPQSEFWDNRSLMDPQIGLGSPNTIFRDYITLDSKIGIEENQQKVIVRAFLSAEKESQLDSVLGSVQQEIMQSPFSSTLLAVEFYKEVPLVLNDAQLTEESMNTLAELYGNEEVLPLYAAVPDGRSDDFSLFQRVVPGVYFLFGASDFQKGIISMPHSPNFSVDENSIRSGVERFSSLMVERVKP